LKADDEVAGDGGRVSLVEISIAEVFVAASRGQDAVDGSGQLVGDGKKGAHGASASTEAMVLVFEIGALFAGGGKRAFDED
jgi:hypothetical protein